MAQRVRHRSMEIASGGRAHGTRQPLRADTTRDISNAAASEHRAVERTAAASLAWLVFPGGPEQRKLWTVAPRMAERARCNLGRALRLVGTGDG